MGAVEHNGGSDGERHAERPEQNGFIAHTAFNACLQPLLTALSWNGTPRLLQAALPPSMTLGTLLDLRTVLFRLGYNAMPTAASLTRLQPADMPCLVTPQRNPFDCWVVLAKHSDGRLQVFSGAIGAVIDMDPRKYRGEVYAVKPTDPAEQAGGHHGWVRHAVAFEHETIGKLLLLTFAINFMAMLLPVYVMGVYDLAVFARSSMTLGYLFLGIALAVAIECTLREARGRSLAYLGARMESLITISAFRHILHLPTSAIEQASLSSQIARLKTFETVREAFSGPVVSTLMDLPFIVFFILVVLVIGGNAGWIVITFAVLMAAMVMSLGPLIRARTRRLAQINAERRKFLAELTNHIDTIRNCRAEDAWLKRDHALSLAQLKAQSRLQRLNFAEHTASHVLFIVAGTAVIFYGAFAVMANTMSAGALVALMALVWRILAPVQTLFLNFARLGQTQDVFRQIDQLMRLPREYDADHSPVLPRKFNGSFVMEGVIFRYPNRPEPILRGLSLEVARGECVALAGGTGAGKSTFLKLLAGLYRMQAGAIYIDGLDLRQIDARDLRGNLGYLEEKNYVFSGTLAENIRLSCPEASDARITAALSEFKVLQPGGWLYDIHAPVSTLSSDSLIRRFALARVFIKDVPVYLLDEPSLLLDAESDAALRAKIVSLKGHATIIMATIQPAYMRLASRVVLLQSGRVWAQGAPDATLPLLMPQARQPKGDARAMGRTLARAGQEKRS